MQKIKYGIIHVHTENSLKDSAMKMDDLVAKAGEYGAPAIALTDHGTLTGVEDFKSAIAKYNKANGTQIKCIPGVEAYVEEDDTEASRRSHLLLLPKDYQGFKAISKAVTASNHRLDSQNIPRMNMEILTHYFGEGGEGHGHVIATSACVQGVIASALNLNTYVEKNIDKLQRKQYRYCGPTNPEFLSLQKHLRDGDESVKELSEEIKALAAIADRPFAKRENSIKKLIGTPQYDELCKALERDKQETNQAKVKAVELRALRDKTRKSLKPYRERYNSLKESVEKWSLLQDNIEKLQKSLLTDEELYDIAKEVAAGYSYLFGEGNFYVELQYHRLPDEKRIMPLVAQIAGEASLPLVAANDAHVASNSEEEFKARQIMRSLRFNTWEPMGDADRELYIKTDEELSSILSELFSNETVERAMRGIGSIVEQCDVVFPPRSSHYPVFAAPEGAAARLRALCVKGIEWRYPERKGWTTTHEERMEYELGIIEKLGYCDYLCIVEDFLRYGRLLGKMDMTHPDPRFLADPYNMDLLAELTKDSVGLGIGPGRGSGVGSLVNYLIGVTGIDPIAHGLYFERFLNVERVSPPDIDSDIASEIRDRVIDYIKYKYGEEAVCCIMTKNKLMAKAAIRSCARLLGSEKFDNTTVYLDLGDEICKSLPDELDIKLTDCLEDLRAKYSEDELATTIINNALLIEDTFTNIGMHAAGVIIADNGDVKEYVPLCYVPGKQQFASQFDKVQSEALGLLKMDALGLKNLDVITQCLRLVQKRHGVAIDIETVPFEKEVFENIFATGNTDAVFQFESDGMKRLLRDFHPESIHDLTLLNAMYRPGPIQFIDDVVAVKKGDKKPDYVVPEMADILGETYGYPIYQEELMSIFNKCAGFSLGEADIIRRAMAKKHVEEFTAYKEKFVEGLKARGGKAHDIESFWERLLKFALYAFNKSHSCAYSYVAYYTAWLKYHYPLEYFCAVLNNTALDKIPGVIRNCQDAGISILPPHINESGVVFTINDEGILYGLSNIKGVGEAAKEFVEARNSEGRFTSLANFVVRLRPKKNIIENLIAAGAFDTQTPNRSALLSALEEYLEIVDKIKEQEKVKSSSEEGDDKYEKAEVKAALLLDKMYDISVNEKVEDNPQSCLAKEKELLGCFLSAHPLDSYQLPTKESITAIEALETDTYPTVCGVITNLRIVKRKSDKKEMAFFTLEDKSGAIPVCCFANEYQKYASVIKQDAGVMIKGTCKLAKDSREGTEELNVYLKSVFALRERRNNVRVHVRDMMEWERVVKPMLTPYFKKDEYPLIVRDKSTNQFIDVGLTIDKDALELVESGLEIYLS